jgi:hypothetical protein
MPSPAGRFLYPLLAALLLAMPGVVFGVPSFARQTGLACSQCHAIAFGPALTAYGRQFKLNGYVWGENKDPLKVPLAAMVVSGYSKTSKDLPETPADGFSTNGNFVVQETSLFLAGRMTEHVGSFVQATYSGVDKVATWDNVDVRYARALTLGGRSVVAGVSFNNSPTVQDLWNTAPAWRFPYMASDLVPAPSAAPLMLDGLGQMVLGISAYAMINDTLYLELGAYRGVSDRWLNNLGVDPESSPHVSGLIPYVRATLQRQAGAHYFAAGAFGMNAKLRPDPLAPDTDRYTDFGLDGTYQYSDGTPHSWHINLTWVQEQRELNASFAAEASDAVSNHVNTLLMNASYAYRQTFVVSAGWFNINGTRNVELFAPQEVGGSATGSPDSRGYTAQLEVVPFGKEGSFGSPWVNLRVGLQYTGYQRFNGGRSDYDGFGRAAHDNNTLFAFLWLAF